MVGRRSRRFIFTSVAVLGALPLVVAPMLLLGRPTGASELDGGHIVVTTLATLLGTLWALAFATLAFHAEDEFTQQGAKFAWYWGAIGGVVFSAPINVFIQMGGLHWIDPSIPMSRPLGRAFALGYGLLMGAQFIGYLACLFWWRISKR